ncbi:hypothetical protein EYF80_026167 [Liparis tanakae]|uniref:Uncharacterized protein n=1 Tax=Liparis tanakae TaxID=230148 RepID=A0A4Z2HDB7_9TELE|nr:hypothetical protein EYF80_026167 [Liparis tanakae]
MSQDRLNLGLGHYLNMVEAERWLLIVCSQDSVVVMSVGSVRHIPNLVSGFMALHRGYGRKTNKDTSEKHLF